VLVGAVALATGGAAGAADAPTAGGPVTVRILESSVDPASVSVAPGDTVVWINESDGRKSVVATDASFDSGSLDRGDRFQFAFTEPRTVTYTVMPGPGITGTVVVNAAPGPPAPAPVPAPTQFAYTGAGSAWTAAGGALVLGLGVWLVVSGRRLAALALSGLGVTLHRDTLLPTRRHRRELRARARRGPSRP
jgi:plastocyanin